MSVVLNFIASQLLLKSYHVQTNQDTDLWRATRTSQKPKYGQKTHFNNRKR